MSNIAHNPMGYFYLAFSKEETGAEILRNLLNEG
jgi:hypothetical protein